jgi:hypothetical protein
MKPAHWFVVLAGILLAAVALWPLFKPAPLKTESGGGGQLELDGLGAVDLFGRVE